VGHTPRSSPSPSARTATGSRQAGWMGRSASGTSRRVGKWPRPYGRGSRLRSLPSPDGAHLMATLDRGDPAATTRHAAPKDGVARLRSRSSWSSSVARPARTLHSPACPRRRIRVAESLRPDAAPTTRAPGRSSGPRARTRRVRAR
jgi:hypothetical protein